MSRGYVASVADIPHIRCGRFAQRAIFAAFIRRAMRTQSLASYFRDGTLTHQNNMQTPGPVRAEDDRLLDVTRARWPRYQVDRARHL